MDKLIISDDYTDWLEEVIKAEMIIEKKDDIYKAIDEGKHTAQIARAVVVSRELKKMPFDIINCNKSLLNLGAQLGIISLAHQKKTQVETVNGHVYDINAYVGKGQVTEGIIDEVVTEGDNPVDDGPSYEASGTKLALERAVRYVVKVVPGHIWNHLLHIAKGHGDVRVVAEELKANIDRMVEQICDPK